MIDYTQWDIEDFIDNKSFLHYVLKDSSHDVETWELIIESHPEIRSKAEKAAQILELLSRAQLPDPGDLQKELNHFKSRMILTGKKNLTWTDLAVRTIKKSLPYAASILLLVTIGLGIQMFFGNLNNNQLCKTIVGKGQKSIVILPDNTKVWLNSESELTYPANFGKNKREVSLIGEAYFSVTHDHEHPFLVNTAEIKIKVYGTEFNVKCYKDEQIVETTLIKGSLGISRKERSEESEIMLKPNEQFVYYRKNSIVSKVIANKEDEKTDLKRKADESVLVKTKPHLIQNLNPYPITAWKEQRLVFTNESFSELATKLERWYDVKVIIESQKIRQYRYKGTFENETIEQALSALKLATPFNFIIEKRTVYITE